MNRLIEALQDILMELQNYVQYVFALFWPGVTVPTFGVHQLQAEDVSTTWSDDELRLLIDEGRRQIDRQRAEYERIQLRSQFLVTAATPLLIFLLSETTNIHGDTSRTIWYIGLMFVTLGILGAASVMSAKAEFAAIDAALLTQFQPPILPTVANAYATGVAMGSNTVSTRLTVFHDAVWLIFLGCLCQTAIWLTR